MGSRARMIVFPALRLAVWAVIAVALCVLAFGRGGNSLAGDDALTPTGGVSTPTVAAATVDVKSDLVLTGTVAADPSAGLKATTAGTVRTVRAKVGDAVAADTPLLDVKVDLPPVEQPSVTSPDGTVTQAPPKQVFKIVTLTAGSAGTLASLAVLPDQDVTVGADVATISPGTLSVTAPLTQAQQFRLLQPPASASAQAAGGPAPFECGGVSTAAPKVDPSEAAAPPAIDPYSGQSAAPSTAQVTCHVPPGTTVFAGMSVDLTLDLGTAAGAVTVPVTAVQGTLGTGKVWVVAEGGDPGGAEETAVTLGLTDGSVVAVTEGLAAGQEILEFTPGRPDDDPSAQGGGPGGFGG